MLRQQSLGLFSSTPATIQSHSLPNIPIKVDIHHLHADEGYRLLPGERVEAVKKYFTQFPEATRLKVFVKGEHYSVVKFIDPIRDKPHYYAIYYGVKKKKELGTGSTGKAKLMQDIETGEWSVVKVRDTNSEFDSIYPVASEVGILQEISELQGYMHRPSNDKHYIGMKLAPGFSLEEFSQAKILSVLDVFQIAIRSITALKNLHAHGILHRDIKDGNLVLDPLSGTVSIIDFDLAISKRLGAAKVESACGTLGYVAYEIQHTHAYELVKGAIDPFNIYNEKTEVYALGKTIARILRLTDDDDALSVVYTDRSDLLNLQDFALQSEIYTFLNRMTAKKPEKRPSLEESLTFFNSRLSKVMDLSSKNKKIAVINAAEFVELTQAEKKMLFLALQCADEVCLIDPQNVCSQQQHLVIRQELGLKFIPMQDSVLSCSHPSSAMALLRLLPTYFGQGANTFFVTRRLEEESQRSLQAENVSVIEFTSAKDAVKYRREFDYSVATAAAAHIRSIAS